jgi:putative SOS response-associated peptidase YedK
MCGRYTLHQNPHAIGKRYKVTDVPESIHENFNVAPGQQMPVVVSDESGKPKMELMKWGFVPVWAKDPKIGYKLINARDDTIFDKPMWRSVILKKRCLIPADGFYEWQKTIEGNKTHKQPFYIHPKQAPLFSFAGVWELWKDTDGGEHKTYSIITTEANKEMAGIHDRMPVILHPDEETAWLDHGSVDRASIEPLLHPYEDNGLTLYPVSDEVNKPRNNNPHLLEPVA